MSNSILDLAIEKIFKDLSNSSSIEDIKNSLPKDRNDPLWKDIKDDYSLINLELSALKNAICVSTKEGLLPVTLSVKYLKSIKTIVCSELNYSAIKDKVLILWPDLEREDFSITFNDIDLIDLSKDLNSILHNNAAITVVSHCLAFTAYDIFNKVRDMAKINATSPEKDNTIFTSLEDIPRIDQFTEIVYDELRRRMIAYDWDSIKKSEFTMREFIGPLLVSAIILMDCRDIQMYSERIVVGKFGNGPLHYDIIYNDFHICVAEAKREDLEKGITQNIAQIVACRDEYKLNERKRSASIAFNENEINMIASSGIVSSAFDWIFTRYIYNNDMKEWHFICSSTMRLNLTSSDEEVNIIAMKVNIKSLLKVICGVLKYQKDQVDSYSDKKRK